MSTELAKEQRTLYDIADDLATYFETLAMAEAQLDQSGDFAEQQVLEQGRRDIQAQINRLGSELATKADRVAGVLRRMKAESELLAAEEMRLCERRKTIERADDWLKAYVMQVMRATNQTSIRTATTTLRIQRNGGVQPLEVTSLDAVPDGYKDITVRMPLPFFKWLTGRENVADTDLIDTKQVALEPSQKRIREALAQECDGCGGTGKVESRETCPSGNPLRESACDACHGTGKSTVNGAHLAERGEHLRIL